MAQESEYIELTRRIIASPSFGNSKTYANLLIYLVEATLKDEVPKETTIAEEIFGNPSFDPSESTLVRVYMFNLRKKINKYYQKEGAEETILLTIPKGSYKVEFIEKDQVEANASEPEKISQKRKYPLGLFLIILLISLGLNIFLWKENADEKASYQVIPQESIWSDVLESNMPVHVLLGDLFIYTEFDEASNFTRVIRNASINTREEFETYREQNQQLRENLGTLSYSFLIKNSAEWIKSLTQIFFSHHRNFQIRYMTKFNSKDLQDNHIVVIGMLKTLGIFNNYFENSRFNFLYPGTIQYQEDSLENPVNYRPSGDPDAYHTDYGFIAKFPGPNNNIIILCGGLWDTGASQSLKVLTDPNLLAELESAMKKKYETVPKYFEVLLEVNGIDRTELTPNILHVGRIDPNKNLWAVK